MMEAITKPSSNLLACSETDEDEFSDEYHSNIFKIPNSNILEKYRIRQKQASSNSTKIKSSIFRNILGKRIVLIDSDQEYCEMVLEAAQSRGMSIDIFNSVTEMGRFSSFEKYELAIVEDSNGVLTAYEVGKIFDVFFTNNKVIAISDSLYGSGGYYDSFPYSIVEFFCKNSPIDELLDLIVMQRDSKVQ